MIGYLTKWIDNPYNHFKNKWPDGKNPTAHPTADEGDERRRFDDVHPSSCFTTFLIFGSCSLYPYLFIFTPWQKQH